MKTRKVYSTPRIAILNIATGRCMIQIGSGNTIPEENDAKGGFFDEINVNHYDPWK